MIKMGKKINILGINSSPRRLECPAQQESSTRILLDHALKHISDRADVEIIDLIDYNIKPTEGCYSSDENLNGYHCRHYKDDSQKIFKKFEKADAVIFSSPVYWLEMSSRLSLLFERLTEMDLITDDPKKRLLQGKVAGAIATAHVEGAIEVCYDILKKANYLGFIIPPHAFAFHTSGQDKFAFQNKESLMNNKIAFKNAESVAENVYKMCLLIKNEKQKWILYRELIHPMTKKEKKHILESHKNFEK